MLTPSSSSSRNITGIAARFHAGSLAVCREGGVVALHLGTPEGEVLVTMREKDFVRGARGRCDHNGNPFRSLDEIEGVKRIELPAAELPPLSTQPDAAPQAPASPVIFSDRHFRLAQAFSAWCEDRNLGLTEAAKQFGFNFSSPLRDYAIKQMGLAAYQKESARRGNKVRGPNKDKGADR